MIKLIALDFDGVLIDHPPNIMIDEIFTYPPMKDAQKVVNYLWDLGYSLYVCTNRTSGEHPRIKSWLFRNGLPPMRVTNKKLPGTMIYIDDRAVRFTNWTDISKLLA